MPDVRLKSGTAYCICEQLNVKKLRSTEKNQETKIVNNKRGAACVLSLSCCDKQMGLLILLRIVTQSK